MIAKRLQIGYEFQDLVANQCEMVPIQMQNVTNYLENRKK